MSGLTNTNTSYPLTMWWWFQHEKLAGWNLVYGIWHPTECNAQNRSVIKLQSNRPYDTFEDFDILFKFYHNTISVPDARCQMAKKALLCCTPTKWCQSVSHLDQLGTQNFGSKIKSNLFGENSTLLLYSIYTILLLCTAADLSEYGLAELSLPQVLPSSQLPSLLQ